jgi:hypothetical protein
MIHFIIDTGRETKNSAQPLGLSSPETGLFFDAAFGGLSEVTRTAAFRQRQINS